MRGWSRQAGIVAMYARVWRSISARGVPGLRRACQAVIRSNRSSKDWSRPVSSVQWLQYRPVSVGMPQLSQAGVVLMIYSLGCVGAVAEAELPTEPARGARPRAHRPDLGASGTARRRVGLR